MWQKPFLDKEGRKKLTQAVKAQIGTEAEEFVAVRKRARRQLNKMNKTINNLLDNILNKMQCRGKIVIPTLTKTFIFPILTEAILTMDKRRSYFQYH